MTDSVRPAVLAKSARAPQVRFGLHASDRDPVI